MTRNELSLAVTMAQNGNVGPLTTDKFLGFGLPGFKPVTCTVKELAQLVSWQCLQLNGEIDGEALDVIAQYGRHRFHVVGVGADNICPHCGNSIVPSEAEATH